MYGVHSKYENTYISNKYVYIGTIDEMGIHKKYRFVR